MKFKEQNFTLFAYTNYRATQGYHRLKTPDFKGKGAFHHSLVQQGLSMFFVEQPSHVETVVKLVRKAPDAYIDITVDMDELDLTASEAKATYEEIKQYILDKYDTKVSNLYIAQVKEKYGIIERENYNKPKSENSKQPQCPAEKVEMIEEALRHFKMI